MFASQQGKKKQKIYQNMVQHSHPYYKYIKTIQRKDGALRPGISKASRNKIIGTKKKKKENDLEWLQVKACSV